jgi:hypothetical protein
MAVSRRGYTAVGVDNDREAIVNVPSGTVNGDVLLLFLEADGTGGWDAPAGFTQLYGNVNVGNSHISSVHYRVASNEPASYDIFETNGNDERGNIYLIAYSGVDNATPINNNSRNTGSSSSTANFTNMTPTANNCGVVAFVGTESGNNGNPFTSNWPTNFTEISDNENGPPGTGAGSSGAAFAESIQTSATLCSGSVTISTGNTGYVTYFVALNESSAPTPTVSTCGNVTTGATGVVCTGTNFEATQGTGKLEIASGSNYSTSTVVNQTIVSWSATSITFDFVQGGLTNNSTVYVFVTNDSGQRGTGFPISFGLPPYSDVVADLTPGHLWTFQNNYTDTGNSTAGLRNITNAIAGGGGAFTTTEICEDTTASWQLNSVLAKREHADVADMNSGTVNERTFGGWIMLGGIQSAVGVIYKEGGQVQNLAFITGLGNTLVAQMADNDAGNNVQAFSDFKLAPNRPYHIVYRYSYSETPKEFRLFIDGVEQSVTDGNPITGTQFSSHTGDCVWGDPDNNLETGGTDISYNGQEDTYLSYWFHFAETDGGPNGGNLNKTTQIRDILFRRGALPNQTISSNTQANMQSALDLLSGTVIPDYPLGLRIEASTSGSDIELVADNITFDPKCTLDLEWRGTGTLVYVLENGSSLDSNKIYTSLGGTVNIVNAPEVTVTCLSAADSTAIQNARVLMTAASGGDLPFEDSVTITSSGTTATVSHTSHGLRTGLKVLIAGATQSPYNGVFTITVVDANSYTYTMSTTAASPATGTIVATSVIIDGVTNSSGVATASPRHRYTTDQPVLIIARQGTVSTYYKQGQVNSSIVQTGLSSTVFMIEDE